MIEDDCSLAQPAIIFLVLMLDCFCYRKRGTFLWRVQRGSQAKVSIFDRDGTDKKANGGLIR